MPEACQIPDYSQVEPEALEVVRKYRRLAIVGASPKPERPSHQVMKYLLEQGFEVVPVNPGQKEILGKTCYPSLSAIPEEKRPEVVIVFRRAEEVPPIAEEAVKIGARVLWLQEGIVSSEAAEIARQAGLTVVMNRCFKKVHTLARR
ncbi:CoA-binding protein [Thermosulfurimonas marina]|uniref:CoA-binding protein n=1 Tax=Thermosulfurimonas marina TaxID=2047767 RepID=A0A6H1WQ52_9BACT|nr:CoA-binding protein [Thermosulfurimonas marina]QJA05288.1 CoA-binding protein [Thermosulfurimonas marina]